MRLKPLNSIKIKRYKPKKIKVGLQDAWALLISFFLVIPDGIGHISAFTELVVYRYGLYAAFIGIITVFLFQQKEKKGITRSFFVFLLFVADTLLILLLKGHSFSAWFNTFSMCLYVILFAETNRDHLDRLVLSFLIFLEFWIYINFILIVLIPDGMYYLENNNSYQNWILGYKSSLQYYVLPALCFSWINMKYRKQKTRYYILFVVSWISTIITQNSMLLVGLIVFTLFQFYEVWKMEKIFNIWTYYIIDFVVNLVFLFFFTWFVETKVGSNILLYLGKTDTLSRRATIIWPMTFEYIRKKLLLGNGFYSSQERVRQYRNYLGFIHSHNQILEILFIGGIVFAAFYTLIHIYIGKELVKNKEYPVSYILSIGVFVLYLMMSVEVFTRIVSAPIWLMVFLCGLCKPLHNAFVRRNDCLLNFDEEE